MCLMHLRRLWLELSIGLVPQFPGNHHFLMEDLRSHLISLNYATEPLWNGSLLWWSKLRIVQPHSKMLLKTRSTSLGSELRTKLELASQALPQIQWRSWIPLVCRVYILLAMSWVVAKVSVKRSILSPITERPSPPLNFNYTNQTKDSVQLSWETPISNGGSMITGYIIEKCEDGSDKWLRCNARLCPDLYYRVCHVV